MDTIIQITPSGFNKIVRKDNHIDMIRELLREAGVECTLNLKNQRFKTVTSRKRFGALWRVYFKCIQPTCCCNFVGHLSDKPVDGPVPMLFRQIGTTNHVPDYIPRRWMHKGVDGANAVQFDPVKSIRAKPSCRVIDENEIVACDMCNRSMLKSSLRAHQKLHCKQYRDVIVPVDSDDISQIDAPRCLICSERYTRANAMNHSLRCKMINVSEEALQVTQQDIDEKLIFPLDEIEPLIICPHCRTQFSELSHFHEHLVVEHQCCYKRYFQDKDAYEAWFDSPTFSKFMSTRGSYERRESCYRYYTCRHNVKNPFNCQAFVRTYFSQNGGVVVTYNNVHNHAEIARKRISDDCREYVMRLIRQGFSNRQILAAAKSHFQTAELKALKLSTIGGMRYRKLTGPWTKSHIDLDELEKKQAHVMKVEHTNAPRMSEETNANYFDDSMNLPFNEDDYGEMKPNVETINPPPAFAEFRNSNEVSVHPEPPSADFGHSDLEVKPTIDAVHSQPFSTFRPSMGEGPSTSTFQVSARNYFRDSVVPLLLKSLDNPNVSEHQWRQINDEVLKILKTPK